MRLYDATNRRTPCYWVELGSLRVLFSYQTPIAFSGVTSSTTKLLARRHNDWGRTTGRHMTEAGVRDWKAYDADTFNALLDKAWRFAAVEPFARKLVA